MLVRVVDPGHDRAEALDAADQLGARHRSEPHLVELVLGQRAGLAEDRVGDADLADVVEHRGHPQQREVRALPAHLLGDRGGVARDRGRVLVRHGDARVHGLGERGGPAELAAAGRVLGTAALLRGVKLGVRVALELLAVGAVGREAGDAERARRAVGEHAVEAADERQRLGARGARDQQGELVAAQAADGVHRAQVLLELVDRPAQQLVAGGVALACR